MSTAHRWPRRGGRRQRLAHPAHSPGRALPGLPRPRPSRPWGSRAGVRVDTSVDPGRLRLRRREDDHGDDLPQRRSGRPLHGGPGHGGIRGPAGVGDLRPSGARSGTGRQRRLQRQLPGQRAARFSHRPPGRSYLLSKSTGCISAVVRRSEGARRRDRLGRFHAAGLRSDLVRCVELRRHPAGEEPEQPPGHRAEQAPVDRSRGAGRSPSPARASAGRRRSGSARPTCRTGAGT